MSSTILKEANNRYLAPLAHLVYLMIKKKRTALQEGLFTNLCSHLFPRKDEPRTCSACSIWTFHSTFHFLYSCSRKAPHILDAPRQTGSSNALMSGCCHWAEGWPPSPSYLWAFFFFFLKEQSCVDRSEVSGGAWVLARGSGWPLPHPH